MKAVYIVDLGNDLVKIGSSKAVLSRLEEIRRSMSKDAEIIFSQGFSSSSNIAAIERRVHKLMDCYRREFMGSREVFSKDCLSDAMLAIEKIHLEEMSGIKTKRMCVYNTLQVSAATHRKLKRAAGSRKLFEYADELLVSGMKQGSAK